MGTHPIFESDFDCLTEWLRRLIGQVNGSSRIRLTKPDSTAQRGLFDSQCPEKSENQPRSTRLKPIKNRQKHQEKPRPSRFALKNKMNKEWPFAPCICCFFHLEITWPESNRFITDFPSVVTPRR